MKLQISKRLIFNIAGVVCTVLAALVVGSWLLGRVLSDRWGWSQWLLWMPTPVVLVVCGLGLLGSLRPAGGSRGRKRRLGVWGAATVAIVFYFAAVEHRFLRLPGPGGTGLRLVHWSVQATGPRVLQRHADALETLDGDITILSTLLPPHEIHKLVDRIGSLGRNVVVWPFVLITDQPILEARHLVANKDLHVAVFRVGRVEERPLTIWAIDLPSDPGRPRAEIARRTRRILDQVTTPAPDVVVGDFNMTRGSASLATLFGELDHAFDQAGWGYGATFHRNLALYHIDHALVGPGVRALAYELVDAGIGRHRIQVVELAVAQ